MSTPNPIIEPATDSTPAAATVISPTTTPTTDPTAASEPNLDDLALQLSQLGGGSIDFNSLLGGDNIDFAALLGGSTQPPVSATQSEGAPLAQPIVVEPSVESVAVHVEQPASTTEPVPVQSGQVQPVQEQEAPTAVTQPPHVEIAPPADAPQTVQPQLISSAVAESHQLIPDALAFLNPLSALSSATDFMSLFSQHSSSLLSNPAPLSMVSSLLTQPSSTQPISDARQAATILGMDPAALEHLGLDDPRVGELEAQVQALQTQVLQLQAEKKNLDEDFQAASADATGFHQELAAERAAHNTARDEKKGLSEQLATAQARVQVLETELQAATQRHTDEQTAHAVTRGELTTVRGELVDAGRELQTATRAQQTFGAEAKTLRDDLAAERKSHEETKQKLGASTQLLGLYTSRRNSSLSGSPVQAQAGAGAQATPGTPNTPAVNGTPGTASPAVTPVRPMLLSGGPATSASPATTPAEATPPRRYVRPGATPSASSTPGK